MCDSAIRLAIVLGIFFGCLGLIEEAVYLSIAVFKAPLLAIVPVVLVAIFLVFVGKMSPARLGRRDE
jgi:xanthine/uracil/vitamin C permease (AzgA family)